MKNRIAMAVSIFAVILAVFACAVVTEADSSDAVTIGCTYDLPSGTVGETYSHAIEDTSTEYSIYSGSWPSGLSINSSGYLTGTPTVAGSYTVVMYEYYTEGDIEDYVQYNITIDSASVDYVTDISLSPSSVNLEVGDSVTLTVSLDSGSVYSSLTWSYNSSALTLSGQSGLTATFTATATGSYTVRAYVTANNTSLYTNQCALTITEPITIDSTYDLPSATLGESYSHAIEDASTEYSVYSGSWPSGLSIDDDGYLSGTPTVSGDFTVIMYEYYTEGDIYAYVQYNITVDATAVDYVTTVTSVISSDSVCVGDTITVTVSLDGTVYSDFDWYYVSSYFTLVSESGFTATFTAIKAGSTLIGASVYSNNATHYGLINLTVGTTITDQTITFDANGGTGTIAAQTALTNNTIYLPVDGVTNDGYYLGGWNTESDGSGTTYAAGSEYTVTGDVTLYAVWSELDSDNFDSAAPSTCELGDAYYYAPEMDGNFYTELQSGYSLTWISQPDWLTYSKTTVIGTGYAYTFSGTPSEAGVYYVYMQIGVTSEVICWTITVYDSSVSTQYTISYDSGDGTGTHQDNTGLIGTCVQLPSADGCDFELDGYTLAAWAVDCNGTTVYYALGSIYTIDDSNADDYAITFTAYYVADTGVIIFDANGGTIDSESYSAYVVQTDSQVTVPSEGLTRSGYTFAGWYLSSDTDAIYAPGYVFSITSTSSTIVMYAYWIATGTTSYTVTYNSNGGTGTLSQSVASGYYVVLPTAGFTYSGYSMDSWNTASDGTGTSYTLGGLCQITSAETLYLIWSESSSSDTYTVSFNLNGGSGGIQVQTITSGGTATEPADPTRACYVFQYWQLQGSTGEYDFSTSVTEDITLVAIWSEVCSVSVSGTTVTITFTDYTSDGKTIDWGDGETEETSSSTISHEYTAGASGKIGITIVVQESGENVEYTTFAAYSTSTSIDDTVDSGDDTDSDDSSGTSDSGSSGIMDAVVKVLAIIVAICIAIVVVRHL